MIYLYIVIAIIIFILSGYFKSAKFKGMRGERQVNGNLKRLAKKYGGLPFTDLMLEDNRSSSQIDNLLLTQKALYVIEVKNYSGYIFGDENSVNWTQTIKHINKKTSKSGKVYYKTNISKHQFYNPIKQNHTHINKIKNLTGIDKLFPVVNIVVFGNKAILKAVTHSSQVHVINRYKLKRLIKRLELSIPNEVSLEGQIIAVEKLTAVNILDKQRRKDHVTTIKAKYNKG
jgi:hypothetical protein